MKFFRGFCTICLLTIATGTTARLEAAPPYQSIKIGNYFVGAPYGVAIIVDDATAFVIEPSWEPTTGTSSHGADDPALAAPGVTAPDFSYSQSKFRYAGANITFTWGRSGPGAVIATVETDREVALPLHLPGTTWPQFHAVYQATADGVTGYGIEPKGIFVPFTFRSSPAPAFVRANTTFDAEIILPLRPGAPVSFVAGVGELPALDSAGPTLARAGERYAAQRISASGDWGDFFGAITDTLNNIRLYGSDNKRIVHGIGRGWWMGTNPDLFPYFEWDYFFDGMLSSFEDPIDGRNTVRGILSFQTPDGRIPSFAHWTGENGTYDTLHRSMPPVGALAVWKMQERHPDQQFLAEVYPRLVRWHEWWMKARDGNHDGMLEWGSEQHLWQGAQWETGWDDNVEYAGTDLVGVTMNAYAVDLNSLWSMDAEYLARIATALGKTADAKKFETEHTEMNQRINDRLWNEKLGIYCSRFWEVPPKEGPAITPESAFKGGAEIRYFDDAGLQHEAAEHHDSSIDYDWRNGSPATGVPQTGWSARVTADFTAPESAKYRLEISGGVENFRISVAGKSPEKWVVDSRERRLVDFDAQEGQVYPISLEYFRPASPRAMLRVTVHRLDPGEPGSDWLTRLTPMNFYPLIAGAPDKERADKTLAWMYRPDKFWLPALLPTVPKDDPVWHEQGYWHGHVWAPANYLIWLGMQRYADPEHQAEFARRNVELFMRNWNEKRVACENYNSTDGTCGDEPHYSWSTLLDLIGLESLARVGPDFRPVPQDNPARTGDIVVNHVPFGGKLYRIESRGGRVTAKPETTK